MIQDRAYQIESVQACWSSIEGAKNPLIVAPCGAGKTIIGARILEQVVGWKGRAVCVTHVRELASQMIEKLRVISPQLFPSICSAGLGSRETHGAVVVGTVQTLVKRVERLGHRDILLIDEAHTVGDDPGSSYQKLIQGLRQVNPRLYVVGLTATPWRLKKGHIAGGGIFDEVAHEISISSLIEGGYLVPARAKAPESARDVSQVAISSTGDFKDGELQEAFASGDAVQIVVADFRLRAQFSKRAMIFTTGKEHALKVQQTLNEKEPESARVVFGDTTSLERDRVVEEFKTGRFRYLVAVRCLTTGFDCPAVDTVGLMTSTMSPVLYSQMVGRGMRPSEGKKYCLVLDYGSNVMRHGPVDNISPPRKPGEKKGEAPVKTCKACREVYHTGRLTCPACGEVFPKPAPEESLDHSAAEVPFLEDDIETEDVWLDVQWIEYRLHNKPGKPPTLRVIYGMETLADISEWISIESQSDWWRKKASKWWRLRSYLPFPETTTEALQIARAGGLAPALQIQVKLGGKYPEVLDHRLGQIPSINERLAGMLKKYLSAGVTVEPIVERWVGEGEESPF